MKVIPLPINQLLKTDIFRTIENIEYHGALYLAPHSFFVTSIKKKEVEDRDGFQNVVVQLSIEDFDENVLDFHGNIPFKYVYLEK